VAIRETGSGTLPLTSPQKDDVRVLKSVRWEMDLVISYDADAGTKTVTKYETKATVRDTDPIFDVGVAGTGLKAKIFNPPNANGAQRRRFTPKGQFVVNSVTYNTPMSIRPQVF
jgi:hypothetical protein